MFWGFVLALYRGYGDASAVPDIGNREWLSLFGIKAKKHKKSLDSYKKHNVFDPHGWSLTEMWSCTQIAAQTASKDAFVTKNDNFELCQFLIEHNADPKAKGSNGFPWRCTKNKEIKDYLFKKMKEKQ